jgi:HlyD family secretion protein
VVAALGRLEPREPITEVSVSSEDRLSKLLVQAGDSVKAGQILAYLQSYNVRLADRQRAAAALADAESRLEADSTQGLARIREAELHARGLDEVPPREIEAQEARIRELRTNMELADADVQRYRMLLDKNAISRQEFEQQTARLDASKAAVDSQQAQLQRLKAQTETERRIAEAQIATRKAELESSRRAAQIASLKENVRVAEAQLEDAIIRAKSDGQIIEILARPGESVQGRPILRMGDVTQMYALAEVYETDVSRVQVGQAAEAYSPALPARLTGRIERIGTNVFKRQVRDLDPQADVDGRVVRVRIRLDDSKEAARLIGLQVNVRIDASK